jgi:hypothetical protein
MVKLRVCLSNNTMSRSVCLFLFAQVQTRPYAGHAAAARWPSPSPPPGRGSGTQRPAQGVNGLIIKQQHREAGAVEAEDEVDLPPPVVAHIDSGGLTLSGEGVEVHIERGAVALFNLARPCGEPPVFEDIGF